LTAAELPEGQGGGGSTEAQEESDENFAGHVKHSLLNFIMAAGEARCG
jgi:hypothetical protein